MERLKMGLVGCGIAATREILPPLTGPTGREAIDLVAVCDLVEERAREAARRFGVPAYYTDHKRMLTEADLDIVGIATPIPYHFPIALDAIRAGKHVYVQKTMTVTVDEATRLIEAAKEQGVKIVASPGTHLSPAGPYRKWIIDAIIRWLDSGEVGKLAWGRITAHMRHEDELERETEGFQEIDPSWYYKPGGGPLRDLAVYPLHAITWVLGPAKKVAAISGILLPEREWKGKKIHVEMDDCTTFVLEFADGVQVTVNTSFIKGSPVSPSLELVGSKGAIIVGGRGSQGVAELWVQSERRGTYGYENDLKEVLPREDVRYPLGSHILSDILHLAECIREDKTPRVSAEHARHVIEIIEKAYEAAHTGITQPLITEFERPGR